VSPGSIARLPSGVLKPERTHEFGEFERLGAHHARLVLGMLRETRVLKSHRFHLLHRIIDQSDSEALLLACHRNITHECDDPFDRRDDIRDGPARIVNKLAARFDAGDRIADECSDFLRGVRGAACEITVLAASLRVSMSLLFAAIQMLPVI